MADRRQVLDLFAGAGGWDEGLAQLGHRALGIEIDEIASATAEAAGHERLVVDVAALDPQGFAPVWGLIASPPCQSYTLSANYAGRKDKAAVIACAHDLAKGRDTRAKWLGRCLDDRSLLTVEPLRFVLALRPRWVAFEQVPPVIELWEVFAELLTGHGYQVAVSFLSSERYGVPQVRKRAFLIASLDGPVEMPSPTHRSFNARRHRAPEHELHLRQWVSVAEALGWGGRPTPLRSTHTHSGRYPTGDPRSFDRPAFTLMRDAGRWKIETKDRVWRSPRRGQRRSAGAKSRRHRFRRRTELVTVEQGSIIQGFRADYPWQGTRSQCFSQIGNSVCPPVAQHVLREAMKPSLQANQEASER